MIVDAIMGLLVELVAGLNSLANFAAPSWLSWSGGDWIESAQNAGETAQAWGAIVPWNILHAITQAVMILLPVAVVIRLLRRGLSVASGGGGS